MLDLHTEDIIMNKMENCDIHILEGNPDNKQLYESERSLCMYGDIVYYDGESCVCQL